MNEQTTQNEENATHSSEWMSGREAARWIGRKAPNAYRVLYRLAKAKKLRAGHDGKHWIFKAEDLTAWLYLNGKKISR
jgi:hypothetical protein